MKELGFECVLEKDGWARSWFQLDGARYEFTHGYCENPLKRIASVAAVMARGTGLARREVFFDLEPDGYVTAAFTHRDPTSFELRRRSLGKPSEVDSDSPATRTVEAGDILMRGEIDSVRFAVTVGAELDRLLRTHGLSGYLSTWRWHFPLQEYLLLRLFLDESALVERLADAAPEDRFGLELELLRSPPRWSDERIPERFGNMDPWE